MKRQTLLAQAGSRRDGTTGAVSTPIYQTATFSHPALGESTGYDYSRSGNPTRQALEETLAALDSGSRGLAFSSGLAAISTVLQLFSPGDRLVVTEDLYGGTFRLLERVFDKAGLTAVYVDTSDTGEVERVLSAGAQGVFLEIPTNPLLKVADLPSIARMAKAVGALLIVDNTFLTPARLKPLDHGADVVVYSVSKYLSGHNDVIGGAVVAADKEIGEKLYFYQNAVGAVLSPFDSFLALRGLKTLDVRLARQEENALAVAKFLSAHPAVAKVHYPGLEGGPAHDRLKSVAEGFGAMLSFEVADASTVARILKEVKVFLFAESLGGTESLITFPAVQTHADIPEEARERLGINDRLLRLSIGIEHLDDLIADLAGVL